MLPFGRSYNSGHACSNLDKVSRHPSINIVVRPLLQLQYWQGSCLRHAFTFGIDLIKLAPDPTAGQQLDCALICRALRTNFWSSGIRSCTQTRPQKISPSVRPTCTSCTVGILEKCTECSGKMAALPGTCWHQWTSLSHVRLDPASCG